MAAAGKKEPYAEYTKHTPACCLHCIFNAASRQNFSEAQIADTLDLLGNVAKYPNTDLVEYGFHGQWAILKAVRNEMFVRPKSAICSRAVVKELFPQIDAIFDSLALTPYSTQSSPPLVHVKFARGVGLLITEVEDGQVCEVSHIRDSSAEGCSCCCARTEFKCQNHSRMVCQTKKLTFAELRALQNLGNTDVTSCPHCDNCNARLKSGLGRCPCIHLVWCKACHPNDVAPNPTYSGCGCLVELAVDACSLEPGRLPLVSVVTQEGFERINRAFGGLVKWRINQHADHTTRVQCDHRHSTPASSNLPGYDAIKLLLPTSQDPILCHIRDSRLDPTLFNLGLSSLQVLRLSRGYSVNQMLAFGMDRARALPGRIQMLSQGPGDAHLVHARALDAVAGGNQMVAHRSTEPRSVDQRMGRGWHSPADLASSSAAAASAASATAAPAAATAPTDSGVRGKRAHATVEPSSDSDTETSPAVTEQAVAYASSESTIRLILAARECALDYMRVTSRLGRFNFAGAEALLNLSTELADNHRQRLRLIFEAQVESDADDEDSDSDEEADDGGDAPNR
jgi:hypothetical protein